MMWRTKYMYAYGSSMAVDVLVLPGWEMCKLAYCMQLKLNGSVL